MRRFAKVTAALYDDLLGVIGTDDSTASERERKHQGAAPG